MGQKNIRILSKEQPFATQSGDEEDQKNKTLDKIIGHMYIEIESN
jgi:hypothetical protein